MARIKSLALAARAKLFRLKRDNGKHQMLTRKKGRAHRLVINTRTKPAVSALASKTKTCSLATKTQWMISISKVMQST